MGAKEIRLKLLVHREKAQILYAESEQDFVDVLFSFLTMPIGTIIHLTAKQTKIGCMSTLYESLKDLNVKYLQSEACKNMLLHPKSAAENHCRDLVVTIDDRGATDYYLCNGSIPFSTHVKHLISTSLSNKLCRCGEKVNWKVQKKKWKKRAGDGDVGVFVKGKTRYMITDDLQVSPVCTRTTLELLKSFDINDASLLEERNVNLGSEEALSLLKASLTSETVLSDVFLKKPMKLRRRSSFYS